MTTQQLDVRLDATAIVEAQLHGDREAHDAIIGATDDVGHWRNIACYLAGQLVGTLKATMTDDGPDTYIAWMRGQALASGDD